MEFDNRERVVLVSTEPNPDTFAEGLQDEYGLPVKDILGVIWRRLWVIVLVALVVTASAVSFDLLQTPLYQASIKVLVGQEQTGDTPSTLVSDIQGLQQLTKTMTEVAPTRPVASAVIQRLDLQTTPESFLANMSIQQASGTQVLEVSYRDPDPERARLVANTIGEVFSEQISEVSPNANAITATVWEEAVATGSPVSPNLLRDGLIALILGGMLGVGLVFLLEQLDDRWRSPEEVEQISGVPTFGVIREFKKTKHNSTRKKRRN